MTITVTAQIQLRKGTAAAWTSANPTLASGEVGYETDTGKQKIGDGTTAWTSLAYYHDPDGAGTYAPIAKGVTNGDSHDHSGGDGAQIAYSGLSGLPTLGTAATTAATDYATAAHVHGNLTNAGAIGSTANLPVITGASGVLAAGAFGTGATDFCVGNDARLSDARTPTSHAHGNLTNAGAIGSTENLPVITTTAGALTVGAFGTGATNFCAGNDARLSDARTPASHAHGNITNAGAIGSTENLPVITTTAGALTTGAFGTGATHFCAGNDARLSDARTPTAHSHEGTAILSTGEAGGTKYLREDGDGTSSWQAVPPSVDLAQLHAAALSF
jgi:hypothetical protein